jgi:hypothetical protein
MGRDIERIAGKVDEQNRRDAKIDPESSSYFYSLVKPRYERRMMKCLKCGVPFVTTPNVRTCSKCSRYRERVSDIQYYKIS